MEFDNLFEINKYPHFPAHGLEPADDGPCLCLSGENYINCCKNMIAEKYYSVSYMPNGILSLSFHPE